MALMTKILIVDDEEALRRLIRTTLEIDDNQVIEAADGVSAVRVAGAEFPRIVFLDIGLPERNGFDVCRDIKSDPGLRGTIVVMLTAHDTASDRQRAKESGADYYLTKPFSPVQLLGLVDRALTERDTGITQNPKE